MSKLFVLTSPIWGYVINLCNIMLEVSLKSQAMIHLHQRKIASHIVLMPSTLKIITRTLTPIANTMFWIITDIVLRRF